MTARLRYGGVTHVMGVINMSPESNNTHTVAGDTEVAVMMADRYRQAGATVIDIGGQSSHYSNPTIETSLEIDRLAPAVERLVSEGHVVSVDTWKPEVAEVMIGLGVAIVNDTGGLSDSAMAGVVAESGVTAIAMYIEGANPHDVDEVEITADKAALTARRLAVRLAELESLGISDVIVDPGISINYRSDYEAYTRMQLDVIRGLNRLRSLGRPILVPIPRKQEDHRVAAYIAMALENEADMIRVHDVEMACDLARLYDRLVERS
ncbi:MAG TPA: dihydropteroate synthase [Acidimicrobiia bacterium]